MRPVRHARIVFQRPDPEIRDDENDGHNLPHKERDNKRHKAPAVIGVAVRLREEGRQDKRLRRGTGRGEVKSKEKKNGKSRKNGKEREDRMDSKNRRGKREN